jgi:glycosyltransferase involved in cell wall biosynthesis
VLELLVDESRRRDLAERARRRARREFTVKRMVELVEETYNELLSRTG